MRTAIIIAAVAMLLGGCQENLGPLTVEGACKAFRDPKRIVYGKTRIDQRWISGIQETGIKVCKWQRPAAPKRGALTS